MDKIFEHKAGTLTLRDDGIMHLRVKEGIDATRSDVNDIIAQKRLWNKNKVGLIVDRQEAYSTGVEIFNQEIEDIFREFAAVAYVVYSKLGKIASEEVISHRLENVPAKIFRNEVEAVFWLKKVLSESPRAGECK